MRSTVPVGVRACFVALSFLMASAFGADQKSPLIGATRQQVLQQYGDPRSVIAAGGREVFFYARERIILRDGVVIDVEPVAAEPARRGTPGGSTAPVAAPPAPTVAPAAAPETPAAAPARGTASAKAEPAPATAAVPATATGPAAAAPATTDAAREAPRAALSTAGASEPEVLIKRVRPPTGGYVRPPPAETAAKPAATAPATAPAPAPVAAPAPENDPRATLPARDVPSVDQPATTAVSTATPPASEPPATAATPATELGLTPQPAVAAAESDARATTDQTPARATTVKPPAAKKKKTVRQDDVAEPAAPVFTTRSYVIAALAAAFAAYLFWRWRQRQLELDATSVSRTPFAGAASVPAGGMAERFTAGLLSKLDQKRFEELVAAYYGKTGVIATRTEAGSNSPVQIKISWKGESRPFALVQCIAQPQGLVEAQPIQELFAVMNTDDIRRGYVITSGKFNVAARDFAEEKHLTLLSGDIFLEKLNALPDSARAELIQQVAAGNVAPAA